MTRFYFVRHGKTEFNVNHIFQGGQVDSPLLAEGIDGAVKAGKYLADVKFDLATVSIQKRAMDTANYILTQNHKRDGLVVRYLADLREIDFGDYDGTSFKDIETSEVVVNLRTRPELYDPAPFHGETYDALLKRSTSVIQHLVEEFPAGNILIVSHGVTLITLINTLLGKSREKIRENSPLANTGVTIMETKPENPSKFSMIDFNQTSFLK